MNCPRCAGLMIGEEVQVISGRFHGRRCVQCGLWLDKTIVRNRLEPGSEELRAGLAGASSTTLSGTAKSSRSKRPGKA